MITSLRKSYSSLSAFEICQAIAGGTIKNNWLSDADIRLAESATEDNAEQILSEIDNSRSHAYAFWQQFN